MADHGITGMGKHKQPDPFTYLKNSPGDKPAWLLLVQTASFEGIFNALNRIETNLQKGANPSDLSAGLSMAWEPGSQKNTLSLVGRSCEEFLVELNHARQGLPRAVSQGSDWQTPTGSYFCPNPLGPEAGIAFVYPGAFNSYPGMGRELFGRFPDVIDHLGSLTRDPWHALMGDKIYPPDLDELSSSEFARLETELVSDPVVMLSSGTTLSIAITWMLTSKLQIIPQAAFGYSLGESSMLFALGVWNSGDESLQVLEDSPVFQNRLAGQHEAVCEYWEMSGKCFEETDWKNYIVMAESEQVQRAIGNLKKVYITHINTPRQAVIGGDPVECRKVLSTLNCPSLQAPFDHVLHCPPVRLEYDGLIQLNDWPVTKNPSTQLISAGGYKSLVLERKKIAASIASMLCDKLDFPRLVNETYETGARIFIEVGPGSNCSRWIDETLQKKPHLAISTNRKGTPDRMAFLKLIARLAGHNCLINATGFLS